MRSQFIDDTSVVIEAKIEYVEATFNIFRFMGRALGLYVKESKVKAILVSNLAMLEELKELDWCWENETNVTKLLRFFISNCISIGKMVSHLVETLEHYL